MTNPGEGKERPTLRALEPCGVSGSIADTSALSGMAGYGAGLVSGRLGGRARRALVVNCGWQRRGGLSSAWSSAAAPRQGVGKSGRQRRVVSTWAWSWAAASSWGRAPAARGGLRLGAGSGSGSGHARAASQVRKLSPRQQKCRLFQLSGRRSSRSSHSSRWCHALRGCGRAVTRCVVPFLGVFATDRHHKPRNGPTVYRPGVSPIRSRATTPTRRPPLIASALPSARPHPTAGRTRGRRSSPALSQRHRRSRLPARTRDRRSSPALFPEASPAADCRP